MIALGLNKLSIGQKNFLTGTNMSFPKLVNGLRNEEARESRLAGLKNVTCLDQI